MSGRIVTSIELERKIIELQKLLKMSTKAAVMRIAIGISLNKKDDPRKIIENGLDRGGATYQVLTITGEYNEIYKMLFSQVLKKELNENEYLELLIAHIYRGVELLYSEYELKGNYNKLVDYIMNYI